MRNKDACEICFDNNYRQLHVPHVMSIIQFDKMVKKENLISHPSPMIKMKW